MHTGTQLCIFSVCYASLINTLCHGGCQYPLILQNVGQWPVLAKRVFVFTDRIRPVQFLFQSIMGFVLRMYRLCDMSPV